RLLFAGEHLHIVAQCALVALQREDVVGLLVDDFLRDVALATHGVDGHHRALDGQQLEQRRNGDDLVGLVADSGLPEHHALARGEGRNKRGLGRRAESGIAPPVAPASYRVLREVRAVDDLSPDLWNRRAMSCGACQMALAKRVRMSWVQWRRSLRRHARRAAFIPVTRVASRPLSKRERSSL